LTSRYTYPIWLEELSTPSLGITVAWMAHVAGFVFGVLSTPSLGIT